MIKKYKIGIILSLLLLLLFNSNCSAASLSDRISDYAIGDCILIGDTMVCQNVDNVMIIYHNEEGTPFQTERIQKGEKHIISSQGLVKIGYQLEWEIADVTTSDETNTIISVQPKWKPETYTIRYHNTRGKQIQNPASYVTGKNEIMILPMEDSDFIGWYDNEECQGNPVTKIDKQKTGNIDLYAKWKNKVATIYLETNTKQSINPIIVPEGELIVIPKEIQKQGYLLEGWYQDKEMTQKYDLKITPDKDMTLYAKWEKAYTITTELEELQNSIILNKTIAMKGDTITVEIKPDSKITFKEVKVNGHRIIEQDGIYSFPMPETDCVLTAEWVSNMVQNDRVVLENIPQNLMEKVILTTNLVSLTQEQEKQLENKVQSIMKQGKLACLLDIKLNNLQGEEVTVFAEPIMVRIKLDANLLNDYTDLQVVYLGVNGETQLLNAVLQGEYLVFETNHLSQYGIIGTAEEQKNPTPKETLHQDSSEEKMPNQEEQQEEQQEEVQYSILAAKGEKQQEKTKTSTSIVNTGDITILVCTSVISVVVLANMIQFKMAKRKKKNSLE